VPTPKALAAAVKSLAEAGMCGYTLMTGQPCPVHDNGAPAQATITVKPQAADPDLLTIEVDSQGIPPAAIAHALRHAAEQLDKQARAAEAEQAVTQQITDAVRRALADEHPADREQPRPHPEKAAAEDDPRPVITIDLAQPIAPAPESRRDETVLCAHHYGLMRDSCPGCDAEQEVPHEADPVTVRPTWAKRDMRRCRRCALVPSHAIHRAGTQQ
jgi:hypothetical protein